MPFADNHGVRLHWEETGEGTPVLLVMGHRFSSRMWYPVIPVLAEKHRVIWFDNRGTGESDAPHTASVGALANDALAVLDAAGVDTRTCTASRWAAWWSRKWRSPTPSACAR